MKITAQVNAHTPVKKRLTMGLLLIHRHSGDLCMVVNINVPNTKVDTMVIESKHPDTYYGYRRNHLNIAEYGTFHGNVTITQTKE